MDITTDVGVIAKAADDVVLLASTIVQDREPIRHARIMNRLIDILLIKCEKGNISPDVEVKATCAQLSPDVQQQITTILISELPHSNPTQLNIFSPLNTKTIMEKDPNLEKDSLDFTTKIALLIKLTALKLGKDKAKAFCEAVTSGIAMVDLTLPVTLESIISNQFTTLQKIAAITNIRAFMQLSVAAQYIYNDIVTKRFDLMDLIKQFIAAEKSIHQLKKEGAAEAAATDPNLNQDELDLAADLATTAVEFAVYFGKDKAAEYVNAIIAGVSEIDDNTEVSTKELVDTSFGAAVDIAKMVNLEPLVTGLTVANGLYDEFADGSVPLRELYNKIEAVKKEYMAKAA